MDALAVLSIWDTDFYATQKYICDTSVVFTQGQMNEKNTGFLLSVQRRIPTRSSHEF